MNQNTIIYMAPMEGLTGYVYRSAYHHYYGGVDKYFTPFVASEGLSRREIHDVLPEHNEGIPVVPQILANRSETFLKICEKLSKNYGYSEVNLNLGCPSGTVASRGRGAGFLRYPEELRRFLEEIFEGAEHISSTGMKISVKTRIGTESTEEWPEIFRLLSQYPFTEMIIHPRLLKDFYKFTPHYECFSYAAAHRAYPYEDKTVSMPLCYNGDVNSTEDWSKVKTMLSFEGPLMLGRGILSDPILPERIKAMNQVSMDGGSVSETVSQRNNDIRLRDFLEDLRIGYSLEMGEGNALFRLKELWANLGKSLPKSEKEQKKIKKARTMDDYRAAVRSVLSAEGLS